jgi:hypothetical protein
MGYRGPVGGVIEVCGSIDDCRWIVYPDLEEPDLFLLREDGFRVTLDESGPNEELLRKWNEENREFWNKIYEYHEK